MILLSPLSGYKNVTTFTFTDSSGTGNSFVSWGDTSFAHNSSATHVYSEIGVYPAFGGNPLSTSAFSVSVYEGNFWKDRLTVSRASTSSLVTVPYNFTINLSSKNPVNTVILYASGSNSAPYNSNRNFWSHLTPEWEFLQDNNTVSEITISGFPVYIDNLLVGYSASSSISFKDDMPGNPVLFFTLQKDEEYLPTNSRVYAAFTHSICAVTPDILYITADGINPINKIQWVDKNIPYVISVGSTSLSNTSILHYVSGNIVGVKMTANCFGINKDAFVYSVSPVNLFDENCFPTGGYSLSTFFYPSSALSPIEISNNLEECNFNFDKVEYYKNRYNPQNIVLSANGIFYYNNTTYNLSGVSNSFDILSFENRHNFYRKGEDYTVYDILKESLPFDLNDYPNFNSYLSAVAGEGDSLGKVYDKIYNFTRDHSDVDICTPRALEDKFQKFDEDFDDFGLELPEELKRLFHYSSIPLQKLIGTRCVCNTNFINCAGCQATNICTICKFDKRSNLGEKILFSDFVSAGETILYRENNSEVFNFLNIEAQDSNVYELKSLSANVITSKGITNFCFYRWDKTPQNNPIQSLVNYKDGRNMLNPSLSTNSDWYGDNGIIEEMFNYLLTKNLVD
jgi:hypothetical protein